MQRFKLVGLVLMTALVLGALTVAVASATMSLPEFNNGGGFTGTSGRGVFVIAGQPEITCSSDATQGGTEAGSKRLGTFHIHYLGCTTFSGVINCNSLGDGAKEILVLGSWHLVLNSRGTHRWFMLFLWAHQHWECATTLFVVLGTLLGQIEPTGVKTKRFMILLHVVNGNQEFTEYENEGETIVRTDLKGGVNEGPEERATLELTGWLIEFANANEILN